MKSNECFLCRGHAAKLYPGAGDSGGPEARREASASGAGTPRLLQYQGQRQGCLYRERHHIWQYR